MGTVILKTTELVDHLLEVCEARSQRAVAADLGVSPSTITNWRRGTGMDLTYDMIVRCSRVLDLPMTRVVELHYGRELPDDVATEDMLKAIEQADTLDGPSGP